MIKLIDILNEDDFQSEEPSSFSNEQEVIQDYIDTIPSKGTTMGDVMEDAKDYPHAFQLRLLIRIAKDGLLNLSNSNIKVKPEGVLKMFNAQSDIAYDALANYNLNEDNPCWEGYKVGNPKTKISSKTGKRVNNCIPINEMGPGDLHYQAILKQYEKGDDEMKSKVVDTIAKVSMTKHKQPNIDTIKNDLLGLDEDEIKDVEEELGINPFTDIDEAFFIGEDEPHDPDDETTPIGNVSDWNKEPMEEEIDEYDVENIDDMKEFLQFMKEYKQTLAEANCDCVYEAEYHGHEVQLGKPMQGDIKKFKVYVKNPKGKVVKVNFGAHGMNIKKNNPVRRKAYRARHHCDNPGPRTKANYWSCRKW